MLMHQLSAAAGQPMYVHAESNGAQADQHHAHKHQLERDSCITILVLATM